MGILTYRAAWNAISARIHGLERASAAHAAFLAVSSQSPYGADKELAAQAYGVLQELRAFCTAFSSALPKAALDAFERFNANGGMQIDQNVSERNALLTRTSMVKLIAFEAELSYTLHDPLEHVRAVSEVSFMHLQRLIVADPDQRNKWQKAFGTNEVACEKLGGIHLLWHGIWAFKIDAAGARTDLVYQEPLRLEEAPAPVSLVLTEWKVAKDQAQADVRFREAREQANLYAQGPLAGVELRSHRYVVVVTPEPILVPADLPEHGVTYRHINLAVEPSVPSKVAKTRARTAK